MSPNHLIHTHKPKLSLTDETGQLLTDEASLEFVSACLVNPEKQGLTIMNYDEQSVISDRGPVQHGNKTYFYICQSPMLAYQLD